MIQNRAIKILDWNPVRFHHCHVLWFLSSEAGCFCVRHPDWVQLEDTHLLLHTRVLRVIQQRVLFSFHSRAIKFRDPEIKMQTNSSCCWCHIPYMSLWITLNPLQKNSSSVIMTSFGFSKPRLKNVAFFLFSLELHTLNVANLHWERCLLLLQLGVKTHFHLAL